MTKYNIDAVEVKIIDDDIEMTPELEDTITSFINDRYDRPLIAHSAEDEAPCFIEFIPPKDITKFNSMPHKDIELNNHTCRIYTIFPIQPQNLTDDDINFAKKLWTETVYVEKGQDGQPWIDI